MTALFILLLYAYNITYTVLFALYTKYQFKDEKLGWERSTGEWHKYGLAMRVMNYIGPFVGFLSIPVTTWKDWLLCGVMILPLWDMLVNVLALQTSLFYNGSTSTLDKKFKGIKWIGYAILLIGAVIIKFTY